jgi:hypothetical protein
MFIKGGEKPIKKIENTLFCCFGDQLNFGYEKEGRFLTSFPPKNRYFP